MLDPPHEPSRWVVSANRKTLTRAYTRRSGIMPALLTDPRRRARGRRRAVTMYDDEPCGQCRSYPTGIVRDRRPGDPSTCYRASLVKHPTLGVCVLGPRELGRKFGPREFQRAMSAAAGAPDTTVVRPQASR